MGEGEAVIAFDGIEQFEDLDDVCRIGEALVWEGDIGGPLL
jgi:hypothetical protein